MAIDYANLIEELKKAVVDPVTAAANELLAQNQDAAEFLKNRAKRVAELGIEYVKAKTDEDRAAILQLLDVVRQSIQNEIASVAVHASIASRETFQKVMNAAIAVAIKAIPIIVAAL